MSCAGLLAAAFGPSYTYVLLRLVYGQKWSSTEAPAALAYYCGYITLLALNGCTEAYVNAVADTRSEHHVWHVGAAKLHAPQSAGDLHVAAANKLHCAIHNLSRVCGSISLCCFAVHVFSHLSSHESSLSSVSQHCVLAMFMHTTVTSYSQVDCQ